MADSGASHSKAGNSDRAVLVTGGAGYIGSHTVKGLLSQGREVVVLDRLERGHGKAVLEPAELVVGDVGDGELLRALFGKYDFGAVIHFAAYAYVGESVEDPLRYYENNVAAPLTLLQVMREFGCQQFVFSSTCATYGEPERLPLDESLPQNPINPYGWSKRMLEQVLWDCEKAYGLRSVFLRYFNASGADGDGELGENHDPETHLIPLVLQAASGQRESITVFGQDYDTPDGTCIRDYIHVEDLASAHALALNYLQQGGNTMACNLGTGQGFSVKEIIETASAVTKKEIPVVYGDSREGDPAQLVADASKAKEILGWEAQHKDVRYHVETAWKWMTK